ncbi:MAG: hypothetical protein U0350_44345 [Caldilineaceae bacterium]
MDRVQTHGKAVPGHDQPAIGDAVNRLAANVHRIERVIGFAKRHLDQGRDIFAQPAFKGRDLGAWDFVDKGFGVKGKAGGLILVIDDQDGAFPRIVEFDIPRDQTGCTGLGAGDGPRVAEGTVKVLAAGKSRALMGMRCRLSGGGPCIGIFWLAGGGGSDVAPVLAARLTVKYLRCLGSRCRRSGCDPLGLTRSTP